jgi:acetoin utilization protein AcuC
MILMQTPLFFGSEVYRGSSYGMHHPLRVPRVFHGHGPVARAWAGWGLTSTAEPARETRRADDLAHGGVCRRAGDRRAQQTVSEETRARHGLGTVSNPVFPEMFRRPATAAGASLLAGELLARSGVIYHPAAARITAFPTGRRGSAISTIPVLAILSLRRAGVGRIAYVDIDAHHADGVEHGLAGDPDTLLISVHEERRWPFTGALEDDGGGNVLNLPVPRGFNDSEMAAIRER